MENNIQSINLSLYQPVEAVEKENRSGWIDYGNNNLFPQHLINLYQNSPIHNALVNSIAYMIEGQGTGTILDNALQGIAFDLKLQGAFVAEVIWSMDFTRVVQINHLPFENCRLAYDKEEDDITGIHTCVQSFHCTRTTKTSYLRSRNVCGKCLLSKTRLLRSVELR
jgi:hypothetical protein